MFELLLNGFGAVFSLDILVLVTGDSDFIPAMKFARREGLKVYVDPMGHGIRRDLRAHADFVF